MICTRPYVYPTTLPKFVRVDFVLTDFEFSTY